MKKVCSVILAISLFLGTSSLVFAQRDAESTAAVENRPPLKMTEQQKNRMISLKTQLLQLKKEIIKYNTEQGVITKEQAQRMQKKIDARIEALKSGQLDGFHRRHSPRCKDS